MTYADYLRQTSVTLFHGADTYWRIYNGGLIPASPAPSFLDVGLNTSKRLVAESKACFIRWSSEPSKQKAQWWWVVCDEYDPAKLSSNTRSKRNRGQKRCNVRRLSAEWLAFRGYGCYKRAFDRYHYATPVDEETFRISYFTKAKYPTLFEYWGVFVEDQLAGYVECVVEKEQGVNTSVIKYDPDYLRYYSSYAMMDALLTEYVNKRSLTLSNGNRAVLHDTNIQDFLAKFGFRRQYCRLNIQYRWPLKLVISIMYPSRRFLTDWKVIRKAKALLFQEELRRLCQ